MVARTKMKQSTLDTLENMGRIISRDIDRDFRHVSFILRRNDILAIGCNNRKTHPRAAQIGYRFSEPHSELAALLKLPKDSDHNDLVLVNFRFNRRGEIKLSRPCTRCETWCRSIFKNIFYTTDNRILQLQ